MTNTPIQLNQSVNAWGTPDFTDVFKQEVLQLDPARLPLQQALSYGNYVSDKHLALLILKLSDDETYIRAKVGIMFSGIIAGCHCSDDPSPDNEHPEYCEVLLEINKANAQTSIHLLEDE